VNIIKDELAFIFTRDT